MCSVGVSCDRTRVQTNIFNAAIAKGCAAREIDRERERKREIDRKGERERKRKREKERERERECEM